MKTFFKCLGHIAVIFLASNVLFVAMSNASIDKLTISTQQPIDKSGRLHVIFSQDDEREPRFYSAWPTTDVEPLYSVDLERIDEPFELLEIATLSGFPHQRLSDLPMGTYRVQAVFDTNVYDSGFNSLGNWYSPVVDIEIKSDTSIDLSLDLNQQITSDPLPNEQELLKFVRFKSDTLSDFWQREMYLRAGIILPRTYYEASLEKFPVFFDIGGYASRYTRAEELYADESFQTYWMHEDTPQMVIVFLDGEAPFGDPYQINSANNGPYGDATWNEFLPFLTDSFKLIDNPKGRFVSGCSTGGWVSLALQIYYPELFNGAWSYSADGVDFRYFQLVNIYDDDNAFFNEHGVERPSFKQKDGDVIFSIKHEVGMENTMGRTNSFVTSGGQWGGWNAVYSPKGEDGLPMAIWDANTGVINKDVAEAWKAFDLRHYTESNWQMLEPKLRGKLNIWMGDMDEFYLNNAMLLFEEMLSTREPSSDAKFTWKRNTGHCDFDDVEMRKQTITDMMNRFESMR